MKVYLGADHRGFQLKKNIKSWLKGKDEYEIEDLGAHVMDPNDDYTTFASRVASAVVGNEGSRGIIMCGSGVGVDVMANKFDGIRASIGKEVGQIKAGRKDDNMNVLVIAADFTTEDEASAMIKAFLETEYTPTKRYERRLQDIEKLEKIN